VPTVDLSVIIPTYNEANRIGKTLEEIILYLRSRSGVAEIIVVDDGSTDQTITILQAFQKQFDLKIIGLGRNQGKGAAIRAGMMAARGALRLFTDADQSTPISDIEKLEQAIQSGADIAIGSRSLPDSDVIVPQPAHRGLIGKLFKTVVRRFYLPHIQDTQCGFKLFTAASVPRIFPLQQIESMVFDVELLYLAQVQGLQIAEVPITWRNSTETRFRVTLLNALIVVRDLWRVQMHRALRSRS